MSHIHQGPGRTIVTKIPMAWVTLLQVHVQA